MFLGELAEVLEATLSNEFQECMVPLFKQIARCLNSSHFQNGIIFEMKLVWLESEIVGELCGVECEKLFGMES